MKNIRYDVSPAKYQRGNAHHRSFNSRRTANYCVLTIPNACPRDLPNPSTIHQPAAAPDRLQGQCYSSPSSSFLSLEHYENANNPLQQTPYRSLHPILQVNRPRDETHMSFKSTRDSTTSPGVVQMNSASRTQPTALPELHRTSSFHMPLT